MCLLNGAKRRHYKLYRAFCKDGADEDASGTRFVESHIEGDKTGGNRRQNSRERMGELAI